MRLREANAADIAFVMRTERLPGYERNVGQWSEAEHAEEMARINSRYLIAEENEPVAFAILQTLDDPCGNIYLKRIAVARQGEGIGARALRLVQDYVFAMPAAHRFFLHFAAHNERGRRLYAAAGFRDEGVERECYIAIDSGVRVDAVRASILRQEWQVARAV